MLGGFRTLVHDGALGDEAWHRKKARQPFKFLLSRPRRRASKEEVIELLWPESDPETGSANLCSAIHAMRRALGTLELKSGDAMVSADRHSVWLHPGADVWVDADEFKQALEQARQAPEPMSLLQHADALYAGECLPEDLYEDWATERRDACTLRPTSEMDGLCGNRRDSTEAKPPAARIECHHRHDHNALAGL